MLRFFTAVLLVCTISISGSLAGVIQGKIFDEINNEPITGANIKVQNLSTGAVSDLDGFFKIENLPTGLYNISVSYIGYAPVNIYEIQVTEAIPAIVNIPLKESGLELSTTEVTASAFRKNAESPVSLNSIGVNEIQRSPGGNRDISKVVQLLPGVATGSTFRNDLFIRGGSSSENKYLLDDIEIPAINHFTTQGASGGSNGLINVDFIQQVDFYSGAFPANRNNAMSSVFEFSQREGRTDKVGFTATVGASDVGLTLEGPLGKKSTFLLSARRSYLQFLFKALGLPFLPTYNDFQFKTVHKFNKKHDLTILGLGAIDDFNLNLDKDETEEDRYQLGYLPYFDQWNYTIGARYRYFTDNSTLMVVASRSMLGNQIFKYAGNQNNSEELKLFSVDSKEAENKLRVEHTVRKKGFRINYGVQYELARYTNNTFRRTVVSSGLPPLEYNSLLKLHKYGAFAQVSKKYFQDKLSLSAGLRWDGTNYSSQMSNPLKQTSPRVSVSYQILDALAVSANAGIYYQLPVYTILGYREADGSLINQDALRYIQNQQIVGGFSYTILSSNTKFSLEGFYKKYNRYPMLYGKGISFANEGGDYGIAGDEPANSTSKGKAYGVEFLVQQKLYKNFYGILSYTFYRSVFTDTANVYIPSSWDYHHIANVAMGYKFKRNWELGIRWSARGGIPNTPYDEELSSLRSLWDANNRGILDYSRYNSERLKPYTQLDIRVDKKWFFKKWNLNVYLDIRNLYKSNQNFAPNLTVIRDDNNQPLINPDNPLYYQTKYLNADASTLLPSVGIVIGM